MQPYTEKERERERERERDRERERERDREREKGAFPARSRLNLHAIAYTSVHCEPAILRAFIDHQA